MTFRKQEIKRFSCKVKGKMITGKNIFSSSLTGKIGESFTEWVEFDRGCF